VAVVSWEHITKSFSTRAGKFTAVDDLNLIVHDREFLVLVGPSGCGKTTLLRLTAGLDCPTAGTIRIAGRVVNKTDPKDRDVAMVFQNHALYPHMTVFENLSFGLKMRQTPKDEIRRRVTEAADLLTIAHLLDRKPAGLSGGESSRVALGRAFVRRPQVFLLDEPLAQLDARLRMKLRSELKRLHERLEATVIHVTHDQEEAMTLGNRIAVMRAGRLQQCGAPLDVYHRPANRFVAGFIGTPPMNFLPGKVETDANTTFFAGAAGRLPLPPELSGRLSAQREKAVVLGVRPVDLRLNAIETPPPPREPAGPDGFLAGSPTRITYVEPLGDSVNVHLEAPDGDPIIARLALSPTWTPGRRVILYFDSSRLHVFTADESGMRLA